MIIRKFHLTTKRSPKGIIIGYESVTGQFCFYHSHELLPGEALSWIISNLKLHVNEFISWAGTVKGLELVELHEDITFDMFWKKYDDQERSSKKRTRTKWERMLIQERLKAYYFIDKYNQTRGSAEKKYAETYLNAELWNN